MPAQHEPNSQPAMNADHSSSLEVVPKSAHPYLKPCPFCGAFPEMILCHDSRCGYRVRCLCDPVRVVVETIWACNVQEAALYWNTRSIPFYPSIIAAFFGGILGGVLFHILFG